MTKEEPYDRPGGVRPAVGGEYEGLARRGKHTCVGGMSILATTVVGRARVRSGRSVSRRSRTRFFVGGKSPPVTADSCWSSAPTVIVSLSRVAAITRKAQSRPATCWIPPSMPPGAEQLLLRNAARADRAFHTGRLDLAGTICYDSYLTRDEAGRLGCSYWGARIAVRTTGETRLAQCCKGKVVVWPSLSIRGRVGTRLGGSVIRCDGCGSSR